MCPDQPDSGKGRTSRFPQQRCLPDTGHPYRDGLSTEVQGLNRITALAQKRAMEALPKANASQTMIALGIAMDKRKALTGPVAAQSLPLVRFVDREGKDQDPLASKTVVRDMAEVPGEWHDDHGAMVNGDH